MQRPSRRPTEAINALMNQYQLLGWAGLYAAQTKAKKASERTRPDLRTQSKYYMKIGVKQNRIQTNHARDQTTLLKKKK